MHLTEKVLAQNPTNRLGGLGVRREGREGREGRGR